MAVFLFFVSNQSIAMTYEYSNGVYVYDATKQSNVLLVAPHDYPDHGFYAPISNLQSRAIGPRGLDKETVAIAELVWEENPYVSVLTQAVHRRFLDVNRPKSDIYGHGQVAYADPRLGKIYDNYHAVYDSLIESILGRFSSCLVIEIHGCGRQPSFGEYDFILGTLWGTTSNPENDSLFVRVAGCSGYRVYVPVSRPRRGEVYTGKKNHSLYEHWKPGVCFQQIEVWRDIKRQSGDRKNVAHVFSSYIRECWETDLSECGHVVA